MRKVKAFFAAVAVLSVVGGAFAFRAEKGVLNLFVCPGTVCVQSVYSDISGVPVPYTATWYKGVVGAQCGTAACPKVIPTTVFFNW